MAAESRTFLAEVDLRYFYCPPTVEKHTVLDLLQQKKHEEILEMVKTGAVSPKETLHPLELSLLALSMQGKPVALGDICILLNALKDKGETLDQDDLNHACHSGRPDVIEMLLNHGAPLGPSVLHHLVERFPFGQSSDAVTKSLKLLVKAKAEVDALNSLGVTPLTTASAAISMPRDVLQCLLDLKADPLGAGGRQTPLHAHVSRWGTTAGVELLVKGRADVNQQDASGKTAVHLALAGHPKFQLAMCLKAQGADVTLPDHQGLRPSQQLLKRDHPAKAAQLEGRQQLNAEELRVQKALEHPVAKKFQRSVISSVSWTLNRSPEDGYRGFCNNEMKEDFPYGDRRLLEDLDGLDPKFLVLQLPLTRYSELFRDLWLKPPEGGFTVTGILMEIYQFYQEPFTKEELLDINAHFGRGTLGDTFGYIQKNVLEDQEAQEPAKKQQRVPRLSLRGDSIFFEGFGNCKYFEDDQTLWGSLSLGS